jgi:RNA polymerase sigma-70 factor (ECF subfamily)
MADVDWHAALAEHNRWLRTVVYARVGQASAVEEVMQEVALAAVGQQAPLADPDKLAPWLYRLAIRQSLLYRRKQGRHRKLVARYVDRVRPTPFDREPDPLEWLLADEREELVRRAMADMPPRDAEILMLKYSEQWTYQQLARHLGTSASAVESRLHRARERLRRQLATFDSVRIKP